MMNGRLNSLTIGFTNALTSPKITATNRIVSSLALSGSARWPRWMPSLRTSAATQRATPLTRTLMPIVLMASS